jgi:hypothetical protein
MTTEELVRVLAGVGLFDTLSSEQVEAMATFVDSPRATW